LRAVVAILISLPAAAAAEPDRNNVMMQVGGGGLVGYDPQVKALAIEAAVAGVMHDPVKDRSFGGLGRVAVVYGNTDHGYFRQLRAGFDTLWCVGRRAVCLLVGVDFGAQWHPVVDEAGDVSRKFDRVLIPRLGIEAGTRNVRLFGVLEHGIYDDHDGDDGDYFETERLAISAGFAIRFR